MLNSNSEAISRTSTRTWVWPITAAIFVGAGVLYFLSAVWIGRTKTPDTAYFNLLADAFLHGRLYLDNPPQLQDLTRYEGRWYVPFPPLPALLLLPWVMIGGLRSVNTIVFAALIGATNVALGFLLVRALSQRGWSQLKMADNLWLVALLGVGSVHWYMSTLGSVWFLAQLCTLTFLIAAVWLAVATGNPLLSGAMLALAALGRPTTVLLFPLLVAIGAQHKAKQDKWGWVVWALLACVPLLVAGALLGAYNTARFGDAFDFGYLTQNVSEQLENDLHRYGQFSTHYLLHNVWAMLLAGPVWDAQKRMFLPTVDGMGLFLTTPALLFLFRDRPRSLVSVGAWIALICLLVPLLLYYNTGWWQFGYRFSLDFMTVVLVLLAVGAGPRLGWHMRLLILLGIAVNAWGCWWFLNPRFFPS